MEEIVNLLNLLSNEYVIAMAFILAPFAYEVFKALLDGFRLFLRRKSPARIAAIIDEVAQRGLVYAEQVAKTTGAKREEKLNLAADMAIRFAQERYGIVLPRQVVIEAIEFFLGVLTIKAVRVIENVSVANAVAGNE
jgi:hypothetical protein